MGCALAFLYGGFHILAWNSQFPSDTQQLLWRISACVVAGGCACIFTLFYLLKQVEVMRMDDGIIELNMWVIVMLQLLLLLAYISARIYLVVDCFIQLFYLEPGAFFEQPRWLAYVPHFG